MSLLLGNRGALIFIACQPARAWTGSPSGGGNFPAFAEIEQFSKM
jgi:hypothetical protein